MGRCNKSGWGQTCLTDAYWGDFEATYKEDRSAVPEWNCGWPRTWRGRHPEWFESSWRKHHDWRVRGDPSTTFPDSPSRLSFPAADGWAPQTLQCTACWRLWSLQRPFFCFVPCVYSLAFFSFSIHIHLLPAFKSIHSDMYPLICWWSCRTSSVLSACVLVYT